MTGCALACRIAGFHELSAGENYYGIWKDQCKKFEEILLSDFGKKIGGLVGFQRGSVG